MFTILEIEELHARVKDGADFVNYIHGLIALGVTEYSINVQDGRIDYYGKDQFHITSKTKYYPQLVVMDNSNTERLQHALTIHQQGQTNYITFCKHSAAAGVKKWTVNLTEMLCTYYNKQDNIILLEKVLLPVDDNEILLQ